MVSTSSYDYAEQVWMSRALSSEIIARPSLWRSSVYGSLWRCVLSEYGPVCAWVGVAAAILLVVTPAASFRGTDFFYYFCVSKLVVLGHGGQAYDIHALGHLERTLAYPVRVPGGVIPNVYPPFFALSLAPLAQLPYTVAYLIWLALSCVLLCVCLRALERYMDLQQRGRLVFRVVTLCSLPVVIALVQGQVSVVLLALLTGAFVALRLGRDQVAGALIGLVAVKPQFVVPLVLLLLLQRRWRGVCAFAGTYVVLLLAPLPVLGPSADFRYVHTLVQAASWGANVGGFAPIWNRSFAGFTQLLMAKPGSTIAFLLLDVLALAALSRVALRSKSVDVPFGCAVVVALLVSQHVLIHDLSLLLVPATVMLRHRREASGFLPLLLGLSYGAILVGFRLPVLVPVQLPTIAMCAMLAWLFLVANRRGRLAGVMEAS